MFRRRRSSSPWLRGENWQRGEVFAWDCTHWGDIADSQCDFWDKARIVAILRPPRVPFWRHLHVCSWQRPGRQAKASIGFLSLCSKCKFTGEVPVPSRRLVSSTGQPRP